MITLFKNPTQKGTPLLISIGAGFIFLIAMFIGLGASINTVFVIGIFFFIILVAIILLLSSFKPKNK